MNVLVRIEAAEEEHSDYSLTLSDARLEEIIDLFTTHAPDLIAVARAAAEVRTQWRSGY